MIGEKSKKLRTEVKAQTIGYILTALGLVAGLAWNDAIKSVIDTFLKGGQSLTAKFLYAVIITIAVVLLSLFLIRFKQEPPNDPSN